MASYATGSVRNGAEEISFRQLFFDTNVTFVLEEDSDNVENGLGYFASSRDFLPNSASRD